MKLNFIFLINILLITILSCSSHKNIAGESTLSIKTILPESKVKKGSEFKILLEVAISPGFHINSNETDDEFLVPTSVELATSQNLKLKNVVFPEAELKKFEFTDQAIPVFEGKINIELHFVSSLLHEGRNMAVQGILRYQACDNKACLPPASTPFSAKIALQ